MKKKIIVGLVLGATAVTGCGNPDASAPAQSSIGIVSPKSDAEVADDTLGRMLQVAASGNWEAYVDRHYGEQQKFRSPADRDALVKRFEEKWGKKLVQGLSRAATLPVQIEGDKAIFRDGEEIVFVLYRADGPSWKFHL